MIKQKLAMDLNLGDWLMPDGGIVQAYCLDYEHRTVELQVLWCDGSYTSTRIPMMTEFTVFPYDARKIYTRVMGIAH